jgi:redox-sensitive bicupin YhaK (pirin superfamily)
MHEHHAFFTAHQPTNQETAMRREIRQIFTGENVTEGAGVRLRRIFGFNAPTLFDPFLLLDDFRSDTPEDYIRGFPWHPHRGIETITYILKGDVEHGDSLGNKGTISSGEVQWMTAGSGIIHQEMPKGDSKGAMHGFQLWANLPASQKMMEPRYRDIKAEDIPVVTLENGTRLKVIAGSAGEVTGPAEDIKIDPEYLDCTVPVQTEFNHFTKSGYTAFLYVIGGEGRVNETRVTNQTLVLFGDGDEVRTSGGDSPLRFLFFSGRPLNEPVAWRGPIVMNTSAELDHAFDELDKGTFIKHR